MSKGKFTNIRFSIAMMKTMKVVSLFLMVGVVSTLITAENFGKNDKDFYSVDRPELARIPNDGLSVDPRIGLMFTDDNTHPMAWHSSDMRKLLESYAKSLPDDTTTALSRGLFASSNGENISIGKNESVGIFFPENNITSIKVHSPAVMDIIVDPEDLPYKLIRKLLPKNPSEKFTLLLFFDQPKLFPSADIQNIVIDELQKRNVQDTEKFSLWGGDILAKVGSKFSYFDSQLWFGMCISGPGVESWSMIIDSSWPKGKISEKIEALKNVARVDPVKTIAMAMQTTDDSEKDEERSEKTKYFSEAFPEVNLLALGVKQGISKYCMDSNSQYGRQGPLRTFDKNHICFIIITYK